MPKREHYLFLCTNERAPGHPLGSCSQRGSKELLTEFKKAIAEQKLGHRVRACASSCLDVCWMGPTMTVSPEGTFYGKVQTSDIPEIINATLKGQVVERLVIPQSLFDNPNKT